MRKPRQVSTVAASLLLSVGVALAQSPNTQQGPTRAPAAQQNAPAEKVAPPMKPGERKAPETTGQGAQPEPKGQKPGTMQQREQRGTTGQSIQREPRDQKSGAERREPGSMQRPGAERDRATTGQGAAGAARLSTEQRTKITTIIRQQKVERANVNVTVRIGTRIPETIRFYPLPVQVVAIYPEWRGYDYILVGDQILILDPRTHEVVAILEA